MVTAAVLFLTMHAKLTDLISVLPLLLKKKVTYHHLQEVGKKNKNKTLLNPEKKTANTLKCWGGFILMPADK